MTMIRGWLIAALAACGAAAQPAKPPVAEAPAPQTAAAPAAAPESHHHHDDDLTGVIDQPAPPWQVSQWFNSPPLSLDQLRGKVVLVRWFMGPSCPFCSGTAPTLRALH